MFEAGVRSLSRDCSAVRRARLPGNKSVKRCCSAFPGDCSCYETSCTGGLLSYVSFETRENRRASFFRFSHQRSRIYAAILLSVLNLPFELIPLQFRPPVIVKPIYPRFERSEINCRGRDNESCAVGIGEGSLSGVFRPENPSVLSVSSRYREFERKTKRPLGRRGMIEPSGRESKGSRVRVEGARHRDVSRLNAFYFGRRMRSAAGALAVKSVFHSGTTRSLSLSVSPS